MQTEIYVSGQRLDLGPETRVVQTLQANNLERPDKIQSNYTNTFDIPATQANRAALEYPDQANSQTKKPYQKMEARVLVDGTEVVPYGICELERSSKGRISLQIYSGNKDFFFSLGEKSIRDLNLAEFDHDFTLQNVINSRGHQVAQGYVYDIINRGKKDQQVQSRWNDLYPSTFVRTLWDKVFAEAGFSYDWQREDEGLFDKLLLPTVAPPKLDEGYRKAREIFVGRKESRIGIANRPVGSGDTETDAWVLVYDQDTQQAKYKDGKLVALYDYYQGDMKPWSGNTYTSDTNMYVDVLATVGIKGQGINGGVGGGIPGTKSGCVEIRLDLWKNGALFVRIDKKFYTGGVNDFLKLDAQKLLLTPGDTLQVRVSVRRVTAVTNFRLELYVPEAQGLDIKVRPEFPPGGRVRLNSWLPNISQREFVKSIIFLYGLMMQTDAYTQTIRINPFSDLLKRLPWAVDWSSKLNLDEEITTEYAFGSFAQRNYIRYAGDAKDEQSRFADGMLVVDNQNLDLEKGIITLPYAATTTTAGVPFVEMFEGRQVQEKQKDDSIKLITEYEEVQSLPRLLIREDMQLPYTYLDENDQPISMPDEGRPVSRFLPELHLKNSIIPRYYDAYQAILDDTRFVKAYFYLTPDDIANLDFAVPVWVEHFNAYWYINQIVQWEAGRSCEVELVRL